MNDNENAIYPCPICGECKTGEKSFYYIKQLRRHLNLRTHPNVTSKSLHVWTCYKRNCSLTIFGEDGRQLSLDIIREHLDNLHRDPTFTNINTSSTDHYSPPRNNAISPTINHENEGIILSKYIL
jgi:hypothetical protein